MEPNERDKENNHNKMEELGNVSTQEEKGAILTPQDDNNTKNANPVSSTSTSEPYEVSQVYDNSAPPILATTPRPSVIVAMRRASFYGDINPHPSSPSQIANASQTIESTSTLPNGREPTEDTSKSFELEKLSQSECIQIIGFLQYILERLELVQMLTNTNLIEDTSLDLAKIPDGVCELERKTKLLKSANLIKYSLGVPKKESKLALELAYLIGVLSLTLQEVKDLGTFYHLENIVEEDFLKTKKLYNAIEHVKTLKEDMEMLNVVSEIEDQAHKEAMRQWAKNIIQTKLELKELRKQNMIQYRYKADIGLAEGDLARRDYEVRLTFLREQNAQLKNDLEVEKKVHEESVEFLKKQNMKLREEAVALQAKIEVDTHNLDQMLEKMRLQRKEDEEIMALLEPRYMARIAEIEAERLKAIRKREEFYANQGKIELETFAVLKIQRIWRGYAVRKVWKKALKKLKKKRLAANKNKGKSSPKQGKKKKKKKL